ncbi:hypothetical protein X907_2080 [Glycocaulis alkaliphilus]|uniref:Uncharacterized protein n=1 Tax=Glycocaulis alkaliphilus TaxID=1434191 RepID=A0A3T0EAY7_9PROT|nr:hypothetical protein [Glycocaulis alkaliphilus]AZU04603.1 hypothetical protein X907_2080 [Glycocaulis alkaliphilus]GGB69178.1 hypothetical protein GCM10007417_06220 [Glycocaulis alkaliphilus]
MTERPIGWRIDRQITLGVLVTLALQTAGGLIWAGATSERIRHLELRVEATAPVYERIARLEENSAYTRLALERIERRLAGE